MQEYKRKNLKFLLTGQYWGSPSDIMPQGKVALLQNIRINQDGVVESRPRLDIIGNLTPTTTDIIHSIKRITDIPSVSSMYIVGAGTKLYTGVTNPALVDTGFSGKPLSLVDFRPEESIPSYCYIGDKNKLKKVSVIDGSVSDWGINQPNLAASAKIDAPFRKIIDDLNATSTWANGGSAGAVSVQSRINTTILAIVEDIVATYPSYISIVPNTFQAAIQEGAIVTLDSAGDNESVVIEKVLKTRVSTGICKVKSIKYTTGSTGECVINLDVAISGLSINDILLINTEYIRVLDVIQSDGVNNSFRCISVGTLSVGQNVSSIAAFRVYVTTSKAITNTITTDCLKSIISASGISYLEKVINIDLTNTSATTGRPLTSEDVLHISQLSSDFSKVDEVQIMLDVDSTTNDFTRNYYTKVLTANDLKSFFAQTADYLPSQQAALQREEIRRQQNIIVRQSQRNYDTNAEMYFPDGYELENFDPSILSESGQLGLGNSQWSEIFVRLEDFIRTGTDSSRGFSNIKAVRISFKTTAAVDVYIDALWVGGGNELNNKTDGLDYNWVWRVKDPVTGDISNWSPPMRNGLRCYRNRVLLLAPNSVTDYSTNFRIQWARFGGQVADFRVIGDIINDGTSFVDEYSDSTVAKNPKAFRYTDVNKVGEADFYKPFPLLDKPRKGICNVVGYKVTRVSGDNFNTKWARGSQIIINGVLTRLYNSPISTTILETEKDLGTLNNVEFYLPDALLWGQPLSIVCGTFGQGQTGLIIGAIGDVNAAGTFYWTDGNNPSTASDINKLEITSPSEPLMGLVLYDGLFYVWSTENSYTIYPTVDAKGNFTFVARHNSNSKGLVGRYAIDVGQEGIYYLSNDGIDLVQGTGNPISLTDSSFRNFFNPNGKKSVTITLVDNITEPIEIVCPDFSLSDEFRIKCCNDLVFFRFIDLESNQVSLVWDTRVKGWVSYDTYKNDIIGVHYANEGESRYDILAGLDGKVASFSNNTNYENGLFSYLLTNFDDYNDVRLNKLYTDIFLDVNVGLNGFDYSIYYNNGRSNETLLQNLTGAISAKRDTRLLTINNGEGREARNIATFFRFLIENGTKFYNYEPSFIPKPEDSTDRLIDFDDAGDISNKFFQGITLECNTYGVDKVIRFYGDDNFLIDTITINHNGEQTKSYSFENPHICHKVKALPDDVAWKYINHLYRYDREPEMAKVWEIQETTHDQLGLFHVFKMLVALRSTSEVTLKVFVDGINTDKDIYKISSTVSKHLKIPLILRAKAGFLYSYRFESNEDFALYKSNCEVWVKSNNSSEQYQVKNPFGDVSRQIGALV